MIHSIVFQDKESSIKCEHVLKTGYGRKLLKCEYSANCLAAASRQEGAWIDESKTRTGYEIPFTRHFYVYQELRPLEVIDREIWDLEREIQEMLKEVTN